MKEKLFAHLLKEMERAYEELYDAEEKGLVRRESYADAIDRFDQLWAADPDTIREFVRFREDPISSDRECAAFMVALDRL